MPPYVLRCVVVFLVLLFLLASHCTHCTYTHWPHTECQKTCVFAARFYGLWAIFWLINLFAFRCEFVFLFCQILACASFCFCFSRFSISAQLVYARSNTRARADTHAYARTPEYSDWFFIIRKKLNLFYLTTCHALCICTIASVALCPLHCHIRR